MPQQRILITGAGSGLGRALARRYARAGYAVACADIQLLHAEETVALLGPPVAGGPHLALPVDVGDDASWSTLATQLAAHWDTLDVLINNAGISSAGTLLEAPMAEWQQILNVNLLGVVRGCRTFAPQLVRQGHGRIINIASFAGLAGAPAIMSYGVAKAGVVALSEQLRAELHHRHVAVSVVCPAFFKTNLLDNCLTSNARLKQMAVRAMEKSRIDADGVAANVYTAAERGDFMILPTPREPMLWRVKRWFPNYYFRKLLQATGERHV